MNQAQHRLGPRITEGVVGGYFSYTALVALAVPLDRGVFILSVCTSVVAVAVAVGMSRSRIGAVSGHLRNGLAVGAVLVAYRQIGWFAQPIDDHSLEREWLQWDHLILVDWGFAALIESSGPWLPGFLEFLYLFTYAIGPAGLLLLYLWGIEDRSDRFLAPFVASAVLAYALYPYFPSEPPRTVFPGDLVGPYDTVFRRVNLWILAGGGIHTSVFPSGHVSSAFGAAFGLLWAAPDRRAWGFVAIGIATAIAIATVYGRYHYAVDAAAGLGVSAIASLACVAVFHHRRSSRAVRDPAGATTSREK